MKTNTCEFSVLVITYNHQTFVEQSIQSILSQKFDGKLQVVIGIDKSTDKTLEICQTYQEKYPEVIELLVHDVNVGMYQNFCQTLKKCTGKYISILEGDDYWTDQQKLQKQFNFFEKYSNCILSAGENIIVDKKGKVISKAYVKNKADILFKEDLIIINRISTLTTAFRRSAIRWRELDKLNNSPHLDWSFYISLDYPSDGFVYKFPDVFGAYRTHSGGVYSSASPEKRNQNILKSIYSIYNLELEDEYKKYIKALFANYSLKILDKGVLSQEPYKFLFDSSEIIYSSGGNKIKKEFISRLYKSLLLRIKSNDRCRLWKMNFELLRQTRPSLRLYLNLRLLPVFPIVFILLWKDRLKRKKILRKEQIK